MKNTIYDIDSSTADRMIRESGGAFTAVLDGSRIHTLTDWIYAVAELFHCPVYSEEKKAVINWYEGAYSTRKNLMNLQGFLDWMTDLSWIDEDREIVLIIFNHSRMLDGNTDEREYIRNTLQEDILHFWDTEVEQCVVEGKKREFTVYLAD